LKIKAAWIEHKIKTSRNDGPNCGAVLCAATGTGDWIDPGSATTVQQIYIFKKNGCNQFIKHVGG
jgi:hypothetical protein